MIPELGHLALILAFLAALVLGVLPLAGAYAGKGGGKAGWMAAGRPAAIMQLACVAAGFTALAGSFYANDFSVLNVAEHSSRKLPAAYRLAAAWGSHEGSMLLWELILAGWTVAVAASARRLPAPFAARLLGVMGLVSTGLLAFILFASNPFLRLDPPPPDGTDLNPLLQDPGMVLHPPLLYMGYVGFSVAFAFAIAALLSGRLDAAWARWARPWTTAAWVFLTLGIAVGSGWAYYELGWGGWWFWDPTENASLMPWLVGTALVHSLAATEKRGVFQLWTVFLAIGAFSLSLVGTFLVRSGVLASVHAFALDPTRGLFILIFLGLTIGGSLLLFALRGARFGSGGDFATSSRETLLLAGNALLLVACATVLLGTLYPLVLDALDFGKVSVGPPYFNAVFVPLMLPVLLLMGAGPLARWGVQPLPDLLRRLVWPLGVALAASIGGPWLAGEWKPQAALGLGFAAWLIATLAQDISARLRAGRPPLAHPGMQLAHLGLALGIAGMGLVSAYESERNLSMSPGDTASLAGYTFTFQGAAEIAGPNYSAVRGTLEVARDGAAVATLHPEKRIYHASRMPITESAIDAGLTRDLYTALGEPLGREAWSVRLFHKPFIAWLWIGALLMAAGGLLAVTRRHRAKVSCGDTASPARAPWLQLAAVLLPAAAGLYLHLGAPALFHPRDALETPGSRDVDAMIGALEKRLAKKPEDPEGWYVLGRSYLALERSGDAARALAKAAARAPGDARILAQHAESLAMAAGGEVRGEPLELVERALAIDPDEEKALELAGLAAFAQEDYAQATLHWRRLLKRLPAESEFHQDIDRAVQDAERRGRAPGGGEPPVGDLRLKKRPKP